MDVRITPYSSKSSYSALVSPRKNSAKTSYFYSGDRPQFERSKSTSPSIQTKKPGAIDSNSILILSKRKSDNPNFSIKITSSMIQPPTVADKKGVLLYQQIERNKLFSNQSELVNRFNYKV